MGGNEMVKSRIHEWTEPEKLLLLEAWARDGLTIEQIAGNMGIHRDTLNEWRKKSDVISAALKKGKEVADIIVENALYKKAIGFKETVKKPMKIKHVDYVDGKRNREYEEIIETEEEIFIPPDTTAQIYWLKNRKPEQWRDKPEQEKSEGAAEVLKNMQVLAEVLRNPVPNRNLEDYEQ